MSWELLVHLIIFVLGVTVGGLYTSAYYRGRIEIMRDHMNRMEDDHEPA